MSNLEEGTYEMSLLICVRFIKRVKTQHLFWYCAITKS